MSANIPISGPPIDLSYRLYPANPHNELVEKVLLVIDRLATKCPFANDSETFKGAISALYSAHLEVAKMKVVTFEEHGRTA